eukprot:TRINITY_DN8686_c0_g2_i2.p1 TRINITY_DN8686_c0_g2~~TRINITY_DN8686_c0_g2_i2.p1  ORF type:complete len:167 (+),score=2.13 TRINITY_DN8686_c0_g2_i2:301-801(+)
MSIKPPVRICIKNNIPYSLQIPDIIAATKLLKNLNSFHNLSTEQTIILNRWRSVFSNKISLALSFRNSPKNIAPDFLQPNADFSPAAINAFITLCRVSAPLKSYLRKALVTSFTPVAEPQWDRVGRAVGRADGACDSTECEVAADSSGIPGNLCCEEHAVAVPSIG